MGLYRYDSIFLNPSDRESLHSFSNQNISSKINHTLEQNWPIGTLWSIIWYFSSFVRPFWPHFAIGSAFLQKKTKSDSLKLWDYLSYFWFLPELNNCSSCWLLWFQRSLLGFRFCFQIFCTVLAGLPCFFELEKIFTLNCAVPNHYCFPYVKLIDEQFLFAASEVSHQPNATFLPLIFNLY